jgi:hypothetical protein
MRIKILSCVTTLLVIALTVSAQPSPIIVGKWQGDKQGSPWVRVNVTREKKGELGGTAVFFILDRTEAQNPPKVLGKQQVQLVDLELEGNVFSFKIMNRQGEVTMNPSGGKALAFQMILSNETQAILKSEYQADIRMLKQK